MDRVEVHPRVSINGISTWQWTIEQDIAFYQSLGVHTVGVPFFKLVNDKDAGIQAIKNAGLKCSSIVGGASALPLIAPPEGQESVALEILRDSIDTAAELGSSSCYFVSGPAPSRMPTDEAFDRLVAALAPANNYAKEKGIRLAIEHNSTSTRDNGFIHTLLDGIELSKVADIDICLELQNCWFERHLAEMFRQNAKRLAVAQVSDFVVGESARLNRRVPGDGDIPLEWMLGKLLDAGYDGLFEIEVLGPSIEEEGYESAITRSIQWLNERLNRWGV